jgi:cytochrome P450
VTTATETTQPAAAHPAGCPVFHQDFSEAKPIGCHWALADRLREQGPVYYNEFANGYWVFTRHDAVRDIYKNPDIFSSESITPWEPDPIYRFVPTQIDRPDHIKYRRILNPWFSPQRMEAAEPMVREICRRLVAETAAQGSCNFVKEFALRYPTEVFLAVIGVDLSHAGDFLKWVEDFFSGFGGNPDQQQTMADALASIRGYWVDLIAERRQDAEPREGDIASYLLNAKYDDERPLTDEEMLDILTVLVLAGLDTTRSQLAYMWRHLALHPEDRKRLIDEPEIIPYAVEEVLRYYTMIFGDGRKVTRDTEFHGASLKKGDMVYGLVMGANRDPRVWDRANEFVIDRKKNNHFGFASGPHRCLGMHLARREMAVAVEEWLRVVPDFHIATHDVIMERGGGAMTAPLELPLAWEVPAS